MKLYDISVPVHEGVPTWPGDPPLRITLASSIAGGNVANVTRLDMGAHTGTHFDAPFHFDRTGYGIDRLPLDILIGACRVFDLTAIPGHVNRVSLERCDLQSVTRALFKTRNSQHWARDDHEFDKGFVGLVLDGAEYLLKRGVRLVGIDYLSIEPFGSKDHRVHSLLLSAQVVILEGLNLSEVPAGDYELIALPMRLRGADGAPARVVLRG